MAKEKNRDPADLWQSLTLERFLVRLASSKYRAQFVLKGGALLSRHLEIGRETTDLDFLAKKISNQVSSLQVVFEEIAGIDLNDEFIFKEVKASELTHPHMGYPGVEISIMAYFGRTRFKVAIDIGFGDIVEPIEYKIRLTNYSKGDFFEDSVELACYPKEFIFAEKLETIIYRGSFNSRMKDFHDIYSMIALSALPSFKSLENVIQIVFEHRETKLLLPISFQENEIIRMQSFWSEYLKNLRKENVEALPSLFSDLLTKINR
ncbi:nucleotidyl transferase AbiEii/AbiGii toxin family protein [Candidatus Protochlamydia sp. R18]|uniref:nucleotidyl transferase AbiEii/AbiGii toxin family protein n=1 Tax=Candidatus Protochlamydia sp. R18 TaxID=1353977 RepID=UPI0009AD89C9|nr:nucleotidyl transferase AbiEii/AbiGii toxin family protein [Candidatus Protochlamydia sp. R18]